MYQEQKILLIVNESRKGDLLISLELDENSNCITIDNSGISDEAIDLRNQINTYLENNKGKKLSLQTLQHIAYVIKAKFINSDCFFVSTRKHYK